MILTVNAGSSSIKVAVFDRDLIELIGGQIDEIGGAGTLSLGPRETAVAASDHAHALDLLLEALAQAGYPLSAMEAAAHRVVHGGQTLTEPRRADADVLDEIERLSPLAPLHNPMNLAAIRALGARAPHLAQLIVPETAYHATNPEVALRYAIPQAENDRGIRRYGFHGLSYAGLIAQFGADIPDRLLAFHLGNGASLCAIHRGRSVATSMGYSPVSGLTMGTRSGDIDAAAVLRLARAHGIDGADRLLNRDSGLKGLAGASDMRGLLARTDEEARFAVEHFCYWAARHGGSAVVAMGGLDAVAFTGGIGQNSPEIRERIMARLACLGEAAVHVVPADEERQLAREALALMTAE